MSGAAISGEPQCESFDKRNPSGEAAAAVLLKRIDDGIGKSDLVTVLNRYIVSLSNRGDLTQELEEFAKKLAQAVAERSISRPTDCRKPNTFNELTESVTSQKVRGKDFQRDFDETWAALKKAQDPITKFLTPYRRLEKFMWAAADYLFALKHSQFLKGPTPAASLSELATPAGYKTTR